MPTGITQHLNLHVTQNADDAASKGYTKDLKYKDAIPLTITDAVVVKDGTEAHNATVDLVMVDKDGKMHITMITMNLLKAIISIDC